MSDLVILAMQSLWAAELRVDFGPSYRVYLGEDRPRIVVLLYGGDKSFQSKDIENTKSFWAEYKFPRNNLYGKVRKKI